MIELMSRMPINTLHHTLQFPSRKHQEVIA